jgi:hypothetical protein
LLVYTCNFSFTTMFLMFAALSATLDDAARFTGLGRFLPLISRLPASSQPTVKFSYQPSHHLLWLRYPHHEHNGHFSLADWLTSGSSIMLILEVVTANKFFGLRTRMQPGSARSKGQTCVSWLSTCSIPNRHSGAQPSTVIGTSRLYLHGERHTSKHYDMADTYRST